MIDIQPKSIISQSPDQVSKRLDEATIIMSIEEGKYFNLNHVASRIWELLEEPCTMKQIVDKLCKEYKISEEDCTRDVRGLLSDLTNLGLIQVN